MQTLSRLVASAAMIGGLLVSGAALAAQPQAHGGVVAAPYAGGAHVRMPPHGFHGAPPTFHGSLPQGVVTGRGSMTPHYELGRRGHDLGVFNGHRSWQFSGADRDHWRQGVWRHDWHNGHRGWWWVIGNLWYFYPAPIYPYPDYIGPDYYYDYYGNYPTPSYYWYYCEDPPGYYPDVQECNEDWEPVPPQ